MVEFKDRSELLDIIENSFTFGLPKNLSDFEVKPYIFDERINWDTHIVTLEGYGVLGFTDSPVNH